VRSGICLIVVAASLLLSGIATAGDLDELRQLVKQGHAEQAYDRLEPLEGTRAGETEFDYLLGIAAFDSRHYDRAVIAFERVLVASPGFSSARFDLARAYFALGADDLARQEFERLLAAHPTPQGEHAIRAYLVAIERRAKGGDRRWRVYVQAGGGHDDNLSSTTPDFTSAINAAFGLPGVTPTGNSILRSAGFASFSTGASASVPAPADFEAMGSIDLRRREYSRYDEFSYTLADMTLGVARRGKQGSIQVSAVAQAFRQKGDTPPPADGARITSDRDGAGVNVEVHRAMPAGFEGFAVLQWMRFRYPTNPTQDTDQAYGSAGVLHALPAAWPGLVLASVFYSDDRARRPIDPLTPGTDVTHHAAGVRAYIQHDFTNTAQAYAMVAWSRRVDDSPFARATAVAYGRDRLTEATVGLVWPWGRWSLRPSVSFVRNQSNIELYSFRKLEGGVNVRYEYP
jgi:hypothetical protein